MKESDAVAFREACKESRFDPKRFVESPISFLQVPWLWNPGLRLLTALWDSGQIAVFVIGPKELVYRDYLAH